MLLRQNFDFSIATTRRCCDDELMIISLRPPPPVPSPALSGGAGGYGGGGSSGGENEYGVVIPDFAPPSLSDTKRGKPDHGNHNNNHNKLKSF